MERSGLSHVVRTNPAQAAGGRLRPPNEVSPLRDRRNVLSGPFRHVQCRKVGPGEPVFIMAGRGVRGMGGFLRGETVLGGAPVWRCETREVQRKRPHVPGAPNAPPLPCPKRRSSETARPPPCQLCLGEIPTPEGEAGERTTKVGY